VAAVAIIGEFCKIRLSDEIFSFTKPRIVGIAGVVVVLTYLIGDYREITNPHLEQVIEKRFPAKAADFIIKNRLSGPLFNSYDWGGYLIWRLPDLPVSIDNRSNVHGDKRIARLLATWSGHKGWDKDPELLSARLVVSEISRPLTSLLRSDTRFELVYEDSTAAVFVRAGNKS
jgi:hypothetical protein